MPQNSKHCEHFLIIVNISKIRLHNVLKMLDINQRKPQACPSVCLGG
jgi:hypothetical protein